MMNSGSETTTLLLSTAETAKSLGVCPRTLYSLRREGELPVVRLRGLVRYDLRDILAFIDQRKQRHTGVTRA
jgi:excisionase family DNA binding protein